MNRYAAVDVGGTTIKFGVLEESGAFLEKRTCPTPPGEQILPAVLTLCGAAYGNDADMVGALYHFLEWQNK